MLGGVLGSPWGEGHWGVPARLAAQGACFVASGGPFAGPCGSWWIPWGPLGGVLVDSLEAPWGSWEGVLGFPCGGGKVLGVPARLAPRGGCFAGSFEGPLEGPWGSWCVPWGPLGEVREGSRLFDCTECASRGVLWGALGGFGGVLGGSLGSWGEALGIPARLAAQGGRFIGSLEGLLEGPLDGPWGSGGVPRGPLGGSLGAPARLAAQGQRFVGSFGGPLEGPWGSWWVPWGPLGGVLGDPRSFGCTGCAFCGIPLEGPWGSWGLSWGPLGGSLGVPARLAAQGACFVECLNDLVGCFWPASGLLPGSGLLLGCSWAASGLLLGCFWAACGPNSGVQVGGTCGNL